MPEGHTIHRLAQDYAARFAGRPATVTSPQGKFSDAADLLTGAELTGTEAHGKHLFLRFRDSDWVHIHLGLFGKVTFGDAPAPPPTDTCLLSTSDAADDSLPDLPSPRRGGAAAARRDPGRNRAVARAVGMYPTCRTRRGVAQLGSASALGAEGRGFKSRHPDHHRRPPDRRTSWDARDLRDGACRPGAHRAAPA